ncbi:hypothetical protein [Escherichia coli]
MKNKNELMTPEKQPNATYERLLDGSASTARGTMLRLEDGSWPLCD